MDLFLKKMDGLRLIENIYLILEYIVIYRFILSVRLRMCKAHKIEFIIDVLFIDFLTY